MRSSNRPYTRAGHEIERARRRASGETRPTASATNGQMEGEGDGPSRFSDEYVMVSNATGTPSGTVATGLAPVVHGVREARVESVTLHGEVNEGYIVTEENNTVTCTLHDGLLDVPLMHPVLNYIARCRTQAVEWRQNEDRLEFLTEHIVDAFRVLVKGQIEGIQHMADDDTGLRAKLLESMQLMYQNAPQALSINARAEDIQLLYQYIHSDLEKRYHLLHVRGKVEVQVRVTPGVYTALELLRAIARDTNYALESHYQGCRIPPSLARTAGLSTNLIGTQHEVDHIDHPWTSLVLDYIDVVEVEGVLALPTDELMWQNTMKILVDWRECTPDSIRGILIEMLENRSPDTYEQYWATYNDGILWLYDSTPRSIMNPSITASLPGRGEKTPLFYMTYNDFPVLTETPDSSGFSFFLRKSGVRVDKATDVLPTQIVNFLESFPLEYMTLMNDTGSQYNADKFTSLFPDFTSVYISGHDGPTGKYAHEPGTWAYRHMHAEFCLGLNREERLIPYESEIWHIGLYFGDEVKPWYAPTSVMISFNIGYSAVYPMDVLPTPKAVGSYIVAEAHKMSLNVGVYHQTPCGGLGIDPTKVTTKWTRLPFYFEVATTDDLVEIISTAPAPPTKLSDIRYTPSMYSRSRGYEYLYAGTPDILVADVPTTFLPKFDDLVTTELLALSALHAQENLAAGQHGLVHLLETVDRKVKTGNMDRATNSTYAMLLRPQWERARIHRVDKSHNFITGIQPRHSAVFRPHYFCVPRRFSFSGPLAVALNMSATSHKILYDPALPTFVPEVWDPLYYDQANTAPSKWWRPDETDEYMRITFDGEVPPGTRFYANTIFDHVGLLRVKPPVRHALFQAPQPPVAVPRPIPTTLFFHLRVNGEYGRGMQYTHNGLLCAVLRNGEYTRVDSLRSHGRVILPRRTSVTEVEIEVFDGDHRPVVGRYTLIIRLGT